MDDIPDWWLYIGMAIFFVLMLVGFNFATVFIFLMVVISIVVNFSNKDKDA